jgi:LmbE family N-acetylglucosaminyl deacetylase
MADALFVFAHQDDEMAMASRILHHRRRGDSVTCVFLTDGGALGAAPARRDAESRAVLTRLGVSGEHIHFLGSESRIADGSLVFHLDEALSRLEGRVGDRSFDVIYCLAWEGGHHDHDASQLVALAFARPRNLLNRCFEMALYTGRFAPGPLFRVLAPFGNGWVRRGISFGDAVRVSALIPLYRSQRRTWLALAPEFLYRIVIARSEFIRLVNLERVHQRPHRARLFYEHRFGVPYERFTEAARAFVEQRLG